VRASLTERRFRAHWVRAKDVGSGNERQRFLAVQQAMGKGFDGRCAKSDEQFIFPFGVATDGSGYVYVADRFNNRIQKFACP